MPPRQLLPPADDVASRALVDTQTAVTRVKELISEGVSNGWSDDEMTKRLNDAIGTECRRIANREYREQLRKALVSAARKWHYELKMTYRVLDENLQRKAQYQPLGLNVADLLRKTPYEKMIEFRKVLDDGTNPGIPIIKDYQRGVRLAMKALSAEPPKTVSGQGRATPIRLRAEMAVRYAAAVENLQELINAGVKFCWISSHASCSPRCAPFQGQLYSLFQGTAIIDGVEYGESGTIDGIPYRPINVALAGEKGDGNGCISGYNCRHRAIEYKRGSRAPADYTEAEMAREYAIDQQQRRMENRIRQMKTEERQLRACGMTKEAAALRKNWRKLTIDYQIYSMDHNRAYYPYRYRIDRAEEVSPTASKETTSSEKLDTSVNWSIINNKQYFDKIRNLGGKKTVGNTLASSVLHTLRHRNNTKGEDLYLIDVRSGVVAAKNTSSKEELGVERTARMMKLLSAQDDRKYILFHNHPQSSPPSITDLNLLYWNHNKIKFGVIVGHDGTIYKYTAPKREIPKGLWEVCCSEYLNQRYSQQTAEEKAFEDIRVSFEFNLEIIKENGRGQK